MIETATGLRPRRIRPPASTRCFRCRRRFCDSGRMRFSYGPGRKIIHALCAQCDSTAAPTLSQARLLLYRKKLEHIEAQLARR